MKVRDIMSQPPQVCHPGTTLAAASARMRDTACGTLAVVDAHGRVAGMLTDRDLALAIADVPESPAVVTVANYMSSPARSVRPESALRDALADMERWKIRRLPVIDRDGDLLGLISIDDIVLWGIHDSGVSLHEVVRTLRMLAGAHAVRDADVV